MELTVKIITERRRRDNHSSQFFTDQHTIRSRRRGPAGVGRALIDICDTFFHAPDVNGWYVYSVNVDLVDGPNQGSFPVRNTSTSR